MKKLSPPQEDYLERIAQLLSERGFLRAVDLAEELGVSAASVTQTLKKLEAARLIERERYRGFRLTANGQKIGDLIRHRHSVLERFFEKLGLPKKISDHDIEGIEHHLSPETVVALEKLTRELPQPK